MSEDIDGPGPELVDDQLRQAEQAIEDATGAREFIETMERIVGEQ